MSTLLEELASRANTADAKTVVGIALPLNALEWLCTSDDVALDDESRSTLLSEGYIDETGELTEPGRFARDQTTRDDRESFAVRMQRGDVTRSLELFHSEGILFVIDDTASRQEGTQGIHHVGYASLGDAANLISRWLPFTSAARDDTLNEVVDAAALVEAARDPEGDTTVISFSYESQPLLDFVHADGKGYFILDDADGDQSSLSARISSLSSFNVYLLFNDAFVGNVETGSDNQDG